MTTLLAILLLALSGTPSESLLESRIETMLSRTQQPEYRAEALWSLIQIYRESDDYREKLFRIADRRGATWLDPLRNGDEIQALHGLAMRFADEHLLLYLLLQIYPEEDRERYTEDFYNRHEPGPLMRINREIASEGTLSLQSLQPGEWDFSIFLLLYYSNRIRFTDDHLYRELDESLTRMAETIPAERRVEREFLYASLFRIHYRLDHFHRIAGYYDELANLSELPLSSVLQNLYMALDFALYRAGHIDRSLELQRRVLLPLTELTENRSSRNQILATHGGYLYTIGRFEEAREAFTLALEDSSYNASAIQTRLLNNLGLVYYKLGDVDRYIATQMRALDYAIGQDNFSHQLSIYRNLHIYYRANRNWDLAEQYIREARVIAEQSGNREELTSILISMAVYYSTYHLNRPQAMALLEEAEALVQQDGNYLIHARIRTEMADLLRQDGDLSGSLRMHEAVRELGADNGNDRMYIGAMIDLADVELARGHPALAARLLREVNAHDISLIDFPELVNARRIEAEIALESGDERRAKEILDRTLPAVLERARSTTDIESGYWNIERAYLRLFQAYSDLLIRRNSLRELANLLDQLKAINDAALIENPLLQGGRLSEEELAESRRIAGRLDDLRKRYLIAGPEEQLQLQREMAPLTARRNQMSRPDANSLFEPADIGAIQERLRGGEMVLHITRILDRLYLLGIERYQIRHSVLELTPSVEQQFQNAIQGLAAGDADLEELYAIADWLGLNRLPSAIRSLVVIPDSYLYQLPLDVLPVTLPDSPHSYGSVRYLTEEVDIRYLNTLKESLRHYPNRTFEYSFTGIGISRFDYPGSEHLVPLPAAVHEVEQIAELFDMRGPTRVFAEEAGTPGKFRESAANSRILHLASHSRISETDPLFSRIWLYPEQITDSQLSMAESEAQGQLFAWQLFDIDLDTELIMLNSCDSGSGDFIQGAGVMGFSRALRYAGAQSLVLNAWAVNDHHAATFANLFYAGLERGLVKSEALRDAKIHFLSHVNADPHIWGAYILNGDNRPLFRNTLSPRISFSLIILIAGLFLVGEWRSAASFRE